MTRPSVTGARLSYLPVGKQHAGGGLRFGMALVGHAEIGPAHAVPAGDEAAERLRVPGLAADRHAADPGARGGGLGGGDARVEGALVRRRELEHADFVPRPAFGEGRGVPQYRSEEHTSELQSPYDLV